MPYILEVQKYVVDDELNGRFMHIGYMDKIFKTKKDASNYYNLYNPELRELNAQNTWCSDWNPITQLRYVVREYFGEHKTIQPFL